MEIKLKVFSDDDLETQCRNILMLLDTGLTYRDIAKDFRVVELRKPDVERSEALE